MVFFRTRLRLIDMRSSLWIVIALALSFPAAALDLEGCVYTPDGTLVPNARITARILEQQPIANVIATDGCFAMTNLPDALLSLTIEADALATTSMLALPGDLPITITMSPKSSDRDDIQPKSITAMTRERGGGTISGTVRVNDKPLAGAPILLHPMTDDSATTSWRVITDAKGRFTATGLALQRYIVTIDDGYPARLRLADNARMYEEGSEPALVDLAKERTATVDIALIKPPVIRGRIVDANDKPVRNARVQVILATRPAADFIYEPFVRTNADGRYAIVAPAFEPSDPAVVIARPPRHSTTRSKSFVIKDSDLAIDLKLPKFESVTMRVVDAEKKPVANARVGFGASEETSGRPDASFLLSIPYGDDAARTDANGEAMLQLVPDTYDFAVDAEQHQLRTLANRAIPRATTIDVTLDDAFAIEGRVLRNNVGVAGVQVLVAGARRTDAAITTDAQGRFRIEGLARGAYRLVLTKYEELVNQFFDVKAPSTVNLALEPAGTLELRMTDGDTRQPVRTFVYSISALADESRPANDRRQLDREASANDGVVRLTIPTGAYRVSINASGYVLPEPAEVRVDEREPVVLELRLDHGLAIGGRVVDETSSAVEGADVVVLAGNAERRRLRVAPSTARTSADGSFTISGLDATDLSLMVRKEGFVPFRQTLTTEANLAPIEVRLSRGLTIEGVVTRAGKPVAEAQVAATTPAVGGEHQPAITDANGHFTLRGLIAARYTVAAYKDEMHAEIRDVDPAKVKELTITLDERPRGTIYGIVTGIPASSGKIVRRTVFASSDENGAESAIDDSGSYRIEDAPLGTVYVTAQVETTLGGIATARRKITLTATQPQRVDLDLGGTIRVSGRVRLEGRPLSGARVTFISSENDGAMSSTYTRDDGAYDVTLATAGRYRIFAFAERTSDRQYSATREIRGGESIDIELREQILEGTVVDAATREPLVDALVTLVGVGVETTSVGSEVQTDALGRFRISTAGAGPHRVIASARGYGHRSIPINLGSANAPMTFELSPVSLLRVRIADAKTNTPLEAHVYLTDLDGSYIPVRSERTMDGTQSIFSVAPGKYRVVATVYGYETQSKEVTAPGDVEVLLP